MSQETQTGLLADAIEMMVESTFNPHFLMDRVDWAVQLQTTCPTWPESLREDVAIELEQRYWKGYR